MKKEYPCEFIQDLLPAYIDGITSAESNALISGHLSGCAECKAVYDSMKEEGVSYIDVCSSGASDGSDAARVVNYMDKLRRKRRCILRVISASIALIAIASVFAIRANNIEMNGEYSYKNTGEMLLWPEGEVGKRFMRNGEEFIAFHPEKYTKDDGIYIDSYSIMMAEEFARFNIKKDDGFLGWLLGTDGRTTMRVIENEYGAELYQSGTGKYYIKRTDKEKADRYYGNIENYNIIMGKAVIDESAAKSRAASDESEVDDVTYIDIPVDLGDKDKHLFEELRYAMADKTIPVSSEEIQMLSMLEITTKDNVRSGTINVLRRGGKWYWAADYDWYGDDEPEMQSTCDVFEFPKSIADRLEDAYNSSANGAE